MGLNGGNHERCRVRKLVSRKLVRKAAEKETHRQVSVVAGNTKISVSRVNFALKAPLSKGEQ